MAKHPQGLSQSTVDYMKAESARHAKEGHEKMLKAIAEKHKKAKEAESMTQDQREAQARKSMTKSENENIDKIRAMMKRERDLRQAQQGRYEGDTGDMNTGKSSGDVYTHSRKR